MLCEEFIHLNLRLVGHHIFLFFTRETNVKTTTSRYNVGLFALTMGDLLNGQGRSIVCPENLEFPLKRFRLFRKKATRVRARWSVRSKRWRQGRRRYNCSGARSLTSVGYVERGIRHFSRKVLDPTGCASLERQLITTAPSHLFFYFSFSLSLYSVLLAFRSFHALVSPGYVFFSTEFSAHHPFTYSFKYSSFYAFGFWNLFSLIREFNTWSFSTLRNRYREGL